LVKRYSGLFHQGSGFEYIRMRGECYSCEEHNTGYKYERWWDKVPRVEDLFTISAFAYGTPACDQTPEKEGKSMVGSGVHTITVVTHFSVRSFHVTLSFMTAIKYNRTGQF
jgi:hypothetical protein